MNKLFKGLSLAFALTTAFCTGGFTGQHLELNNSKPITAIIVEHCGQTVGYLIFDGKEPIMVTDDSPDDTIRSFITAAKLSRFKNHVLQISCERLPDGVKTTNKGADTDGYSKG